MQTLNKLGGVVPNPNHPSENWDQTPERMELYNSFAVLDVHVIFNMPLKDRLLDVIQCANAVLEEEGYKWND